jgi:ATP/maltotriose-dependent transcriptional regulator MalT
MDVFSYLAEQVFQRQSAQVQRFLLRTCCLEHVNAELGERLTGTSSASRNLHHLAKNQVFTFDTGRDGTYRYHNLLRDFLRQRFVQDEGEGAFRALQRATAVALEACGDRPGAVELLLGANEADLALGVIARGGEAELERRPYEQLRLWANRLAPSAAAEQPWALIVSAVLDTRDSCFKRGLESLRRAIEVLSGESDRDGQYQALSIMEWAEFWSGDSAASMATCRRALECATSDAQRLHTLLSLMSAALDMRDWGAVASASSKAEAFMQRARPEETARAQALRAHAAYFQGDMRLANLLAQHPHDHGRMATQRAAALNIRGMIETALGQYDRAASHLTEAMETAADFGHALTTWMIEDSLACLSGATGRIPDALATLETLVSDTAHTQEPSLQAYAFCHRGTILRRAGDIRASLSPTRSAAELAPIQRDPYLALSAGANLAFAEGLLGADSYAALERASRQASEAGLRFVELKSRLFEAVLCYLASDMKIVIALIESCLPGQLELGHINLIAQELGPRPELAALVLRRHRSNGLGPALVEAMSHYWRFAESAEALRRLCPSQVGTWIDHVNAHAAQTGSDRSERSHAALRVSPGRSTIDSSALDELTPRERDVLELMAADRTNDEIAADLFIALPTVKTHINHIRRKLGQTTRVGAVLEYQRLMGLVHDGRQEHLHHHLHPPG